MASAGSLDYSVMPRRGPMAGNSTFKKRQKEAQRQVRRQEKEQKRQQRKTEPREGVPVAPGEDPDIAGIIPGPQPLPDGFEDNQ